VSKLRRKLTRLYDAILDDPTFRDFYDGVGYANYGYWEDGTTSGKAASDALVDRLLARLPSVRGEVLDVGCGHGGTTGRLQHHFGSENVTAVNLAHTQISATRTNAPGCRAAVMDAASLAFSSSSFDVVFSVEAAFHFETREDFLRDAHRVLRPGGSLLVGDVLVRAGLGRVPHANRNVDDLKAYQALLERIGFVEVHVEDVLDRAWKTFRRRYLHYATRRRQGSWLQSLRRTPYVGWAATRYLLNDWAITAYPLVSAKKAE